MNLSILISFIGGIQLSKYGFAQLVEQAGKQSILENLYLNRVREQGYGYTDFRDMYSYQYNACLVVGAEEYIKEHSPKECLEFLNVKLSDLLSITELEERKAKIEKFFA